MNLLTENIELGAVGLKVQNGPKMRDFYTNIIGLELIMEDENEIVLGLDGKPLLRMWVDSTLKLPTKPYIGLYHLALLLPTEIDLGQLLLHFYRLNYQISGAGDHRFSQALYMNDPEGNGIEIYADRPQEEWGIQADGSIPPVTESVDIFRLISLVKDEKWDHLPYGTKMGHVHLQIADVEGALDFYTNTLGMDLKTRAYEAIFVSKNGYHHHLGLNAWSGKNAQPLPENVTGLDYYTIYVDNLDSIKNTISEFETVPNGIEIQDSNGIKIQLIQL